MPWSGALGGGGVGSVFVWLDGTFGWSIRLPEVSCSMVAWIEFWSCMVLILIFLLKDMLVDVLTLSCVLNHHSR